MLKLSANARTNTDEVGDHMNTKLKITNRLVTNNCTDFPRRGDQYIGFIMSPLFLPTSVVRSTHMSCKEPAVIQELQADYLPHVTTFAYEYKEKYKIFFFAPSSPASCLPCLPASIQLCAATCSFLT